MHDYDLPTAHSDAQPTAHGDAQPTAHGDAHDEDERTEAAAGDILGDGGAPVLVQQGVTAPSLLFLLLLHPLSRLLPVHGDAAPVALSHRLLPLPLQHGDGRRGLAHSVAPEIPGFCKEPRFSYSQQDPILRPFKFSAVV